MPPAAAFIASRAGALRAAADARRRDGGAPASASAAAAAEAIAAAAEDDPVSRGVRRELVLQVLKQRRRRMHQCRSLPLALVAYGLFVWAVWLHVSVQKCFDFERP
jgi:hypothetical protein